MKEPEETPEEQLFRVLKQMVESGEVLMEERDGELYFAMAEYSAADDSYDRTK
jgi:hypothetical protein